MKWYRIYFVCGIATLWNSYWNNEYNKILFNAFCCVKTKNGILLFLRFLRNFLLVVKIYLTGLWNIILFMRKLKLILSQNFHIQTWSNDESCMVWRNVFDIISCIWILYVWNLIYGSYLYVRNTKEKHYTVKYFQNILWNVKYAELVNNEKSALYAYSL